MQCDAATVLPVLKQLHVCCSSDEPNKKFDAVVKQVLAQQEAQRKFNAQTCDAICESVLVCCSSTNMLMQW